MTETPTSTGDPTLYVTISMFTQNQREASLSKLNVLAATSFELFVTRSGARSTLANKLVKRKYGKYIRRNYVKCCPKCKSVIERAGGCNHMTWTNWGYSFWWNWGAKYTIYHFENPLSGWGYKDDSNCLWNYIWTLLYLPIQLFMFPILSIGPCIDCGHSKPWIKRFKDGCLYSIFIEPIFIIFIGLLSTIFGFVFMALWPLVAIFVVIRMWWRRTKVVDYYKGS